MRAPGYDEQEYDDAFERLAEQDAWLDDALIDLCQDPPEGFMAAVKPFLARLRHEAIVREIFRAQDVARESHDLQTRGEY